MLEIQSVILNLILTIFLTGAVEAHGPVITIQNGTLRGTVLQNTDGKSFNAFRGIPYAKSTNGQLRFEPPQSTGKWEGVFDATKDGNECSQVSYLTGEVVGDEDCLVLNVYTPQNYSGKILPVLVFIHGGGFSMGTGNSYVQGPEKLMNLDIVLVTFNYRLGILGFLSTEDDNAPGNYGMLDQVQALRWVKENIKNFGGDPTKVIIFGPSAGGGSVAYLMLSPLAKGLFHGAIAQSGTAWATWALQKNPLVFAKQTAEKLNCSTEDTKKMVECFKAATVDDLLIQSFALPKSNILRVFFLPVKESPGSGRFITEEPQVLLKKGHIANKVPFITGVVKDEGYLALLMTEKSLAINITGEEFFQNEFVEDNLHYLADVDPKITSIGPVVMKEYYRNRDVNNRKMFLDGYEEIMADTMFNVAADMTLKFMARAGVPTYAYRYVCQTKNDTNIPGLGYFPSDKVTHGAENAILFNANFFPSQKQEQESDIAQFMTRTLTTVWKNFAETAIPLFTNTPFENQSVVWKQYDENNPNYLEISATLAMREGVLCNKTQFWTQTIPELVKSYNIPHNSEL